MARVQCLFCKMERVLAELQKHHSNETVSAVSRVWGIWSGRLNASLIASTACGIHLKFTTIDIADWLATMTRKLKPYSHGVMVAKIVKR
jgi:hypothetical protein